MAIRRLRSSSDKLLESVSCRCIGEIVSGCFSRRSKPRTLELQYPKPFAMTDATVLAMPLFPTWQCLLPMQWVRLAMFAQRSSLVRLGMSVFPVFHQPAFPPHCWPILAGSILACIDVWTESVRYLICHLRNSTACGYDMRCTFTVNYSSMRHWFRPIDLRRYCRPGFNLSARD